MRAFRQHLAGEKTDSEMSSVIRYSTSSFNDVSQRINRCEAALRDDLDRADLASMIRRIQEFEKTKFEAVQKFHCLQLI